MAELRVIGIGAAGWEAGTDLFLDVVRRVLAHGALDRDAVDVRWVGRRSRGVARWLDRDAELMGLAGRVGWSDGAGSMPDADLVIVAARTTLARDAALGSCPDGAAVVGFDLPEGIEQAGGFDTVQFPDTVALAERSVGLLIPAAGPGSER